ncbi:MAG: arsenite methyltransferase [Syntrophobacteraceae bacterium]|nr:arsenite methyltransferase [Syntrophobacteraceae bacterium]
MRSDEIKNVVRKEYAKFALAGSSCCPGAHSCCGSAPAADEIGRRIGYSDEDLKNAPEGANLGLGCGNPVALASLKEGEIVLDLGSGAGFDCFLAAGQVGQTGKVIGVDMTPDMLSKARDNAVKGGFDNVEFRLGEIEHLPVPDSHVDAIISNCVINLSPEKDQVFREAFRVLKAGGRLMVSDIVLLRELPGAVRDSVAAYVGCIAGAVLKDQYLKGMRSAGFEDVQVLSEEVFPIDLVAHDPTAKAIIEDMKLSEGEWKDLAHSVVSMKVAAVKAGEHNG